MKRLLTLMTIVIAITVVLAIPISATKFAFTYDPAEDTFTNELMNISDFGVQLVDVEGTPVLPGTPDALIEINGEKYFSASLKNWRHPIKYSEETYDFFKDVIYGIDCLWTGEYYVMREAINGVDGGLYPSGMDFKALDTARIPLRFYDKDFKLVQEKYLVDKGIPLMMEYYNNTLYCLVANSKERFIFSSVDTINWTLEDGIDVPRVIGNVANNFKPDYSAKDELVVSIARSDFIKVVYEDGHSNKFGNWFGEWNCVFNGKTLSLTNDGIYYIRAEIPEELHPQNLTDGKLDLNTMRVFEDGDDMVVRFSGRFVTGSVTYDDGYDRTTHSTKVFYIRTPKQPVYNELARMKEAPYIVVNNKVLGFEQAPVMESDRTLVPMRFLFEQMGDSVSWDGSTQSATVQGKNDVVTFSIDNTTAMVNGESKAMDVPARLVNGKTMVPLRFLSEELGYTVEWDGNTRIITISNE